MNFVPELLRFQNGEAVTAASWPARRAEILQILRENIYGVSPEAPKHVRGEVKETVEKCCSGHAKVERLNICFDTPLGEASFPAHLFMPNTADKHPVFVFLNFRPDIYDMYYPAEEIIDHGFALAVIDYKGVTSDDGDFTNGLAAFYPRTGAKNEWGKIGMWAWAASRMIDYLVTRSDVRADRIAVAGHSRLGKTALWCGAQDERVFLTCSNDSGCAGAAYERAKHGCAETIEMINKVFPFWFCDRYRDYLNTASDGRYGAEKGFSPDQLLTDFVHGDKMPFDQHFLLAAVCPRYLCVGSASHDFWADQKAEQLSCVGASPAWRLVGRKGFVGPEGPANVGDNFDEGDIGYHLRDGVHFCGRADWLAYMKFFEDRM